MSRVSYILSRQMIDATRERERDEKRYQLKKRQVWAHLYGAGLRVLHEIAKEAACIK